MIIARRSDQGLECKWMYLYTCGLGEWGKHGRLSLYMYEYWSV